jgi:hypothetical protein
VTAECDPLRDDGERHADGLRRELSDWIREASDEVQRATFGN